MLKSILNLYSGLNTPTGLYQREHQSRHTEIEGAIDQKVNTSELKGKEVIGLNGFKIGKVEDSIFDQTNWQVTSLDIGLKGDIAEELGTKQKFRTSHVLIDVRKVQGVADVITLNTTKEDLLAKITNADIGSETDANPPTSVTSV